MKFFQELNIPKLLYIHVVMILRFLFSPITANAQIPFINRKPSSSSVRKSNIEKAIAFLKSDGANFSGDPAKGEKD